MGVIFAGFDPKMEDRLHLVQVRQGLGREGGLDLFEDGIDGSVKWSPFEDPDQVLVKVEGHQLGQGKRGWDFEFKGVDESPAVGFLNLFGIQGKPGRLERFQVTVDRANPGFFPFGDFGYGQPIGAGFNRPDDPPLAG